MVEQGVSKILSLEEVKKIKPNLDALKIISKDMSEKVGLIFFDMKGKKLKALTTNENILLINQVKEKVEFKGYKIDFFYCDYETFTYTLSWYDYLLQLENKTKKELEELEQAQGLQAISMLKKIYDNKHTYSETDFIKEVIRLSFMSGSSDAHFQPEEDGIWLRLRINGILKKVLFFTHYEFKKYLLKLKSISKVKMNVNYIPQDGRFDFVTKRGGKDYKIDVRVNFMPSLYGESIVMRFLDAHSGIKSFTEIGFLGKSYDILQKNIEKPYGMILVTGPTGSGKSTTLYSILNKLNVSDKKIITLEDPVEYSLPNVQQSQIKPEKGYTYSEGLKAILRQDPDIIMVGEIRDLDTAKIAINAALTGHLVLSTLHTNTAIEAVSRLMNMGVEPFMLAPALNLIIGQRLVRKLCDCKVQQEANISEKEDISLHLKKIKDIYPQFDKKFNGKLYKPAGCEKCAYDGYNSRIAIVETFEFTEDIKDSIVKGATQLDIYNMARQNSYLTLEDDAYIKMLDGLTSLDEIRRVLN